MDFSIRLEELDNFWIIKYPGRISAIIIPDATIIFVLLLFRGIDIDLKAFDTSLSSSCGLCCPIAVIISLIALATLFI